MQSDLSKYVFYICDENKLFILQTDFLAHYSGRTNVLSLSPLRSSIYKNPKPSFRIVNHNIKTRSSEYIKV